MTNQILIFLFQIHEYKTKFNNSEANINTLQGIITVQDEQLSKFEETVHSLKNKEKQFIYDIKLKRVLMQIVCK